MTTRPFASLVPSRNVKISGGVSDIHGASFHTPGSPGRHWKIAGKCTSLSKITVPVRSPNQLISCWPARCRRIQ
jgi:hypothetical protein